MISISKLYMGNAETADRLRYGHAAQATASAEPAQAVAPHRRPVVVWNVTRACNLRCKHCYAQSDTRVDGAELSTDAGRRLIDDLASYAIPVLLFSGGEPLRRPDCLELIGHATAQGLRVSISTNGTLIDDALAERLHALRVAYVGVSLDGLRAAHERFRAQPGCFDQTLAGIRACRRAGLKVGVRFTMTRDNVGDIPAVFDLLEAEAIPRICFYHLVSSGRGAQLQGSDLSAEEMRRTLDLIIDRTRADQERGATREVLTVDNYADAAYLHLRMQREAHPNAQAALELLRANGGNSSAVGFGCVSWDGTVYADQFLRTEALGNVLERPFSAIWEDTSSPLMAKLKDKKRYVGGRCASCRFLDLCGGNLRARALSATGDLWAPDPACYLTDAEIGRP